jgi:hypothetical protein
VIGRNNQAMIANPKSKTVDCFDFAEANLMGIEPILSVVVSFVSNGFNTSVRKH